MIRARTHFRVAYTRMHAHTVYEEECISINKATYFITKFCGYTNHCRSKLYPVAETEI